MKTIIIFFIISIYFPTRSFYLKLFTFKVNFFMVTYLLKIIKDATKEVPAVKYAMGVVGLSAAVALIVYFHKDLRFAFWGIVGLIVLMVLLLIFARLSEIAIENFKIPSKVLMWFIILLFMCICTLLLTSIFFKVPLDLQNWLINTSDHKTQLSVLKNYDEVGKVEEYNEGMILVKRNTKYGFIDTVGNEIVACKYDLIYPFSEGLAGFSDGSEGGYIDNKGKEIIRGKYSMTLEFKKGIAAVCKDNKFGFINTKGDVVVGFQYDDVGMRGGGDELEKYGKIRVQKEGKWGMIDSKGNSVFALRYDDLNMINNGMMTASKNGKYGVIDLNEKVIIDFQFDSASAWNFVNGLLAVKKNGLWGYIDTSHKVIIKFQFEEALDFRSVYCTDSYKKWALAKKNGKYGFITIRGIPFIPFTYDKWLSYGDEDVTLMQNYEQKEIKVAYYLCGLP